MPEQEPATAAELREPLRHERKREQEGRPGEPDDWTQEKAVWDHRGNHMAKLETVSGGDRVDVEQMRNLHTYRGVIRYTKNVIETDRFIWNNNGKDVILNVNSAVNWKQKNKWLVMELRTGR
jgi:SPP1 family predicted phage head-tail adaptor